MSYFTETFESIMEFKGEAELAYAMKRNNETGTHDHIGGKYAHKAGVSNVSNRSNTSGMSNNHNASYTHYGLTDHSDGKSTKDNYEHQKKYHNAVKDHYSKDDDRRVQHSIDKHNRKSNNESYDPVYEDLCRMGIID